MWVLTRVGELKEVISSALFKYGDQILIINGILFNCQFPAPSLNVVIKNLILTGIH
jgi:hypothetical protein